MKNLFKKLHIMSKQSEASEGSKSSGRIKSSHHKLSPLSQLTAENKPFSRLSNWLVSLGNRHSSNPTSSSSKLSGEDRMVLPDSVGSSGTDTADAQGNDTSNSRDPEVEEEYQLQLALELSAREDPEAVQIEAVKQLSLGSCAPANTPAEVVAYRYWNYNALGYDDKIMDGFYDFYGILTESNSEGMPALVHLQSTPLSDDVSWEAVLVNRSADATLLRIEQKALKMAEKSRSGSLLSVGSDLVQKLAILAADSMGGPVKNPDSMAREWTKLSQILKDMIGSMVLPLGSLEIGLARHRALLFKVLADSVGIPCQLVKGQQYTGSDDVAMNIVKLNDGREYIVDLMADPGTLIPSDAVISQTEYDGSFSASPLSRDMDSSQVASSSSGATSSFEEHSEFGTPDRRSRFRDSAGAGNESDYKGEEECKASLEKPRNTFRQQKAQLRELSVWNSHPLMHARSPSWTEGVNSPNAHRMKVKDVSQYMIDAAKENPQLAQRLHDVLLESGVIAPPNLFTEAYHDMTTGETNDEMKRGVTGENKNGDCCNASPKFLHPPPNKANSRASPSRDQREHLKHVEGLGFDHPLDLREVNEHPVPLQSENAPAKYTKDVPVAAAAAAAAAVVASSMVVAATKSTTDSNIKLPVAAATATAAAVAATTAAVTKQYEQGSQNSGESGGSGHEPRGSGSGENNTVGANSEVERISDRSTGNESAKSDVTHDDVADCEIPWEDITLGERIGLGSYGEVYRGDWHGTEVAVKRFVDQDILGESLEELRSEVRIMKRLRHPNIVLFMGAVTQPPNLSIVTEFLPRGSLYRLLHRPNNQLDERRRLRMALDAARGMNYLHNCSPVIVHRDLKSPNLLVEKNWVVKVCDFGLSRMKYSTFLSSRSTAGTAEWMAPEVLRNEPSDEKCDVYSFGVILWELCTMQQPWMGMNAMQVVGAVGFQHRRLDIPENVDPAVADIIRKCWQTDPKLRPTFAEIMAALKPLQKPITAAHVPRPIPSASSGHERRKQS